MKIEIYYMNTKITTEINKNIKNIKVKDLLQDIKNYFNTNEQNFILFNSDFCKLKETDSIPIPKETDKIVLYLTKSSVNNNSLLNEKIISNEKLNINQLIMKCTGAKKPLEIKPNMPQNRFGFFEFLGERNNREDNPFGRLINLLQELEENNMIQIGIERPPEINNNNPVEADENLLRELQEMGFPEDRARQALINSRNNINRATEMLLGESGE